jgi:uncharacterized protein with GYD domain
MPKFLIQASYSAEGIKGIVKGGGSARRAAVQAACESVDGRLESLYFGFGDDDVFAIVDIPDSISAAALALSASSSGLVRTKTTLLLTPEDVDRAAKKRVSYSPPGQT